MCHVFKNLIENAVNYTNSGTVTVNVSQIKDPAGKKCKIDVIDTGVGISDADRAKLFTEGGRGENSVKINVNSTGYGLFIAKRIVEAHSGNISASSKGPGQGSTFTVILPMN